MQTHQRVVFGNMGNPAQPAQPATQEDQIYLHNTLVFEMAANWPYVMDLMKRFGANEIKQVDVWERDWLNFALANHVEMEKYGSDSDQFVNAWFKNNK